MNSAPAVSEVEPACAPYAQLHLSIRLMCKELLKAGIEFWRNVFAAFVINVML